ncbi:MAG: hypothetical protein CMN32_17595 [Saprospirales bacterium]|nr:hypothetical protein [Saprospirales bacterium]
MKNMLLAAIFFGLPFLLAGQNNAPKDTLKKNIVMITPLGDLINDSKSSFYYKRRIPTQSGHSVYLRIGTELFNASKHLYSAGKKTKAIYNNIKFGLEIEKPLGRLSVYYGPEISFTRMKVTDGTLIPSSNFLFSVNSFEPGELTERESRLKSWAFIAFIGFRYQLAKSISIGIESAVGYGQYKSTLVYYDVGLSIPDDTDSGQFKDFAANRFIFLTYEF